MRIAILSALMAVALGLTNYAPEVRAAGCGLQPLKPIPPIGCRDLEASCECDSQAVKCVWKWKCVK